MMVWSLTQSQKSWNVTSSGPEEASLQTSGGDGIPVELLQILKDDVVKVLRSICWQIWETWQWPQDWKRSVFIPIPKKGNELPELAQTHVHRAGDAIQPSYPLIPFSCLQSFPASGYFPMSQFFASGGQSMGASASASVLPMNIQDWFPLGLTGLISLQSKGLSRVLSILGKSKNYSCPSFRKPESRHTLFITGTVAEFTKVITQFLILEPVNMFWRALGQSAHFLLPQRLAMFPQVDVLLPKIP